MNDQMSTPPPVAAEEEAPVLFGTKDAATYLGITYRALKALMYNAVPPLVPDQKIGSNQVFYKATLDAWKEDRSRNMSTDDAAAYLGVPRSDIYYYMHTLTPAKDRLIPTGFRGDRPTFTKEALDPFRGRQKHVRRTKTEPTGNDEAWRAAGGQSDRRCGLIHPHCHGTPQPA